MLKLAANLSLLFTEVPLQQRFACAARAGFSAVEIQFPYELPVATIRHELAQHGLSLVLINVPAGDLMSGGNGLACVPGCEQAFAEACTQALAYAEALQVPRLNVLAGRLPTGVTREQAVATLVDNLKMACPRFAAMDKSLTLEAINTFDMPGFLLSSPQDMADIVEKVGAANLGWQYDLYHMARMGRDLEQDLLAFWPQIAHLQFADVPGRGEPGSGTLDFNALFSLIARLPYAGYCAAEYRPTGPTESALGWLKPLIG